MSPNHTINRHRKLWRSYWARTIPTLLLLGLLAVPAARGADTNLNFLKPGSVAASALLAPPPLMESAEQAADLETVRAVYHAAPEADKQAAYDEKKFAVFNFSPAIGPWFVSKTVPLTAEFFEKVLSDAESVTGNAKDFFKRPRPYTADPSLANGKLEKTFGYPSGHSTESMVVALVLAELFPDRREPILAVARGIGWRRVEIARHYPTDIYAGRVLAQAIVREMKQDTAFQHDFAGAKAELAAATAATVPEIGSGMK